MLVAMLRADGIAADMALLDTGPGVDVTPELPGMNQFDHAIVYLPADGKGNAPLWIDGTAEYAQVGDAALHGSGPAGVDYCRRNDRADDHARSPKPEDDHLTELRDVALADYGPAHITETSLTQGDVDDDYRSELRRRRDAREEDGSGKICQESLSGQGADQRRAWRRQGSSASPSCSSWRWPRPSAAIRLLDEAAVVDSLCRHLRSAARLVHAPIPIRITTS